MTSLVQGSIGASDPSVQRLINLNVSSLPDPVLLYQSAGSSAGTDKKSASAATAPISGDDGVRDSAAAAAFSAEGSSEGGGVSADGGGGSRHPTSSGSKGAKAKEGSASGGADAAAPAGDGEDAAKAPEDGKAAAAAPAAASQWGGKKSFLDVSCGRPRASEGGEVCRPSVCMPWHANTGCRLRDMPHALDRRLDYSALKAVVTDGADNGDGCCCCPSSTASPFRGVASCSLWSDWRCSRIGSGCVAS